VTKIAETPIILKQLNSKERTVRISECLAQPTLCLPEATKTNIAIGLTTLVLGYLIAKTDVSGKSLRGRAFFRQNDQHIAELLKLSEGIRSKEGSPQIAFEAASKVFKDAQDQEKEQWGLLEHAAIAIFCELVLSDHFTKEIQTFLRSNRQQLTKFDFCSYTLYNLLVLCVTKGQLASFAEDLLHEIDHSPNLPISRALKSKTPIIHEKMYMEGNASRYSSFSNKNFRDDCIKNLRKELQAWQEIQGQPKKKPEKKTGWWK